MLGLMVSWDYSIPGYLEILDGMIFNTVKNTGGCPMGYSNHFFK